MAHASLAALLCALGPRLARSVVVGAAVIPHGDFAFDPSLVHNANGSLELHKAAQKVGAWVRSLRPDAIVLTTPHGMELTDDFLVYQNSNLTGCAEVGGDLHNASAPTYSVCAKYRGDPQLAAGLVSAASQQRLNVTGVLGFADSVALPVSWGEIIPLSFVQNGTEGPALVAVSVPTRRYNFSAEMVPELASLGRTWGSVLAASPKRIAVVISSDLAHTHLASGPYGFCKCAEPFDMSVGEWARTMRSDAIRVDAKNFQQKGAESCGFTGLVFLDGVLDTVARGGVAVGLGTGPGSVLSKEEPHLNTNATNTNWSSELLANAHPTYYGMAVARFGPTFSFHF